MKCRMSWAEATLLLTLTPAAGMGQGVEPAQSALAGARVFGAKGCAECHAINGLGGDVGPDLGQIPERRSFYDLGAVMWNHMPQMTARNRALGRERPRLSTREVANLVAFLFTLDYFDAPGDTAAGQRLFWEKRCIGCHQVGGVGGVVGPNLDYLAGLGSSLEVASIMWNHGPKMTATMREMGIARPTFEGSELKDLLTYLESRSVLGAPDRLYVLPGSAGRGRELFEEKRCATCHLPSGEGFRVGPDLGRRSVRWSPTEFASALWNKAPAMMSLMRRLGIEVPQLTARDMSDIVAYLYSIRYFQQEGNAVRGRRWIRTTGCTRCHSLSGAGGSVAPDLAGVAGLRSPASVLAALWNHDLQDTTVAARWPRLRASQLADIAAFLQRSGLSP